MNIWLFISLIIRLKCPVALCHYQLALLCLYLAVTYLTWQFPFHSTWTSCCRISQTKMPHTNNYCIIPSRTQEAVSETAQFSGFWLLIYTNQKFVGSSSGGSKPGSAYPASVYFFSEMLPLSSSGNNRSNTDGMVKSPKLRWQTGLQQEIIGEGHHLFSAVGNWGEKALGQGFAVLKSIQANYQLEGLLFQMKP